MQLAFPVAPVLLYAISVTFLPLFIAIAGKCFIAVVNTLIAFAIAKRCSLVVAAACDTDVNLTDVTV